jgi:hypothetical protein
MLYWLFRLEMGTNIERLPLESMKTIRLTSGLRLCMGLLGLAILSTQSNASPSPRSYYDAEGQLTDAFTVGQSVPVHRPRMAERSEALRLQEPIV